MTSLTVQILQTPYTLGQEVRDNDYHVGVIRFALPRNLAALFPDIRDEIQNSFDDHLMLIGNGNCISPCSMLKFIAHVFSRVEVFRCEGPDPIRCLSDN